MSRFSFAFWFLSYFQAEITILSGVKHSHDKVDKHRNSEDNTVDTEGSEAATLDKAHQEFDGDKRDNKREDNTEGKQQPFKARERAAVEEEFYRFEAGCTEHYRDCHKEGEL